LLKAVEKKMKKYQEQQEPEKVGDDLIAQE
jgi:hypothetical protein